MRVKIPYQNSDIPMDFFVLLSKIPHLYREQYEMSIHHQNSLVINHPIRIIISLNHDINVNVYDSGIVILHNFSIVQLTPGGTLTITL
jgi:hypothetical protein